jgi:hypothetical protein
MEQNVEEKFKILEEKIDKIYKSVEKTRKYFMWTLITTLAFFILPLFGLFFAVPKFIETYSNLGAGF